MLFAAVFSALLQALQPPPLAWRYDRVLVLQQAEIWRLLTASWVHLSWAHWALNSVALACLLMLFQGLRAPLQALRILLALSVLTPAVTLLLFPQLLWFVGLSGALHGLFVWYALSLLHTPDPLPSARWWQGPRYGWVLLAGLALKLLAEIYWPGDTALLGTEIRGSVALPSHWAGVIAAFALFYGAGWRTKLWRPSRGRFANLLRSK